MVDQRCVSGAGPSLLALVLPPDLVNQPAQGRGPVQDVAHQVPGDRADQVQSGGGEGSGQDGQAGLQAGQGRRVVPLQETGDHMSSSCLNSAVEQFNIKLIF